MGWTKGQIVDDAYGELTLAGYVFDLSQEERQASGARLDLMLAEWLSDGIAIGYHFASGPTAVDLNEESGIPLTATRAVILGLAISIAPGNGKLITASTRADFATGYSKLLRAAAFPPEQQLPGTLPRGAGNKPWRTPDTAFMPAPDTGPLQVAPDGGLTLGN